MSVNMSWVSMGMSATGGGGGGGLWEGEKWSRGFSSFLFPRAPTTTSYSIESATGDKADGAWLTLSTARGAGLGLVAESTHGLLNICNLFEKKKPPNFAQIYFIRNNLI